MPGADDPPANKRNGATEAKNGGNGEKRNSPDAPTQAATSWRKAALKMKLVQKAQVKHSQGTQPSEDFVLESIRYREQLARRRRERRFIFRPGESPFLNYWDAAGITVLTYTALFTPFEVAFLPGFSDTSAWESPRFLIARFIDAYFTLDLFLQFVVAYKKLNVAKDGHANGTWVENHKDIARNYLTSWFMFDLGTLVPSAFDIIPAVNPDTGSLGGAAIFRTFRVLRFVKILRVARAGRVMQRWAARITLQHSTKIMIWCVVRLLIGTHWYACIIALQASLHASPEETWMSSHYYDYCGHGSLPSQDAPQAPPPPPLQPYTTEEWCPGIDPGSWYVAAFTWALMIITGTGGTDFYPSSRSTIETVIVLILAFCGAILWTQILADFCDVASNGDPAGVRFRQTLDELNSFCELNYIPGDMALRMREYLHAQRFCQMRLETGKSLDALSPALQVEVIM